MATTNGVNGAVNGDRLPALSSSAEDFLSHNFDYVIVGGGTAGLCIAARLTENPDVTVGVLEVGKNHLGDMLVDCPAMFSQQFSNDNYDWAFKSVPQVRACYSVVRQPLTDCKKHNKNKVHHLVRGKGLGGSAAINYMMCMLPLSRRPPWHGY